jgi:amino acid adenylation domain-containing protein
MALRPGDAVGVWLSEGVNLIALVIAIFKLGAIYVPVDASLPLNRANEMFDDGQVEIIIVDVSRPFQHFRCRTVVLDDLISRDVDGSTNNIVRGEPTRIVYQTYTSGSTGRPKPIRITERSLMSYVTGVISRYHLAYGSSVLTTASISFDASIREIVCGLLTSSTLHVFSRGSQFDVSAYVDLLRGSGISQVLSMTPSILKAILSYCSRQDAKPIETLRLMCIGGEVLDSRVVEEARRLFPRCRFINHYGPSECTMTSTSWNVDEDGTTRARLPVGTPNINTAVAIVHPETGEICGVGEEGEVIISGLGVCLDYAVPPPDFRSLGGRLSDIAQWPSYRTGDLGYVSNDGNLYVVGRRDEQIKLRGIRVEPSEISHTLMAIQGVESAVTVTSADDVIGYRLDSYVILKDGWQYSDKDLIATLARNLPRDLVPTSVNILASFPLNRHGKLDKRALPKPSIQRSGKSEPKTSLERSVCELFAEVLGSQDIGADDSFFELGGHSLLATLLMLALNEAHGCDLPLEDIFSNPTPRALAAQISSQSLIRAKARDLP